MDPLQHLVAPRRPLPSPRAKARDAASRNVFALPVIHQFAPVLASSPKCYMVPNAAKKREESDDASATGVGPPPMIPQRPRTKEGVESPRALRPQPPAGISSRTDVGIYRYSQGTEQRMSIRPLFEQRRGSEGGEGRTSPSTRRKVKKRQAASTGGESFDGVEEEELPVATLKATSQGEDSKLPDEEADDARPMRIGESNQEDGRTSSPSPEDCQGACVGSERDLRRLDDESDGLGVAGGANADEAEDMGRLLLKKLDISMCYEPFLQSEGPKLTWLRDIIESAAPAATTTVSSSPKCQSVVSRARKSDVVVYKTLGKDLRSLGGESVLVSVLLSSRGDAHITCNADGASSADRIIAITDSDLGQSKLLRRDLPVLTPKWADWLITRVRCDSRRSFYVDLTDAEGSERRVCFSEVVHGNGKEIVVEMVAFMTASSLLISVREAASSANNAEILLRADDLRRLALSLGTWPDAGDVDQEMTKLFDDHDFLGQIVSKSNVVRLGMSCAGIADEYDASLLSSVCLALSTDETIDVPTSAHAPTIVEILDSPSYVQEAFQKNNFVGTVAFLAQAYVENGILSTLRRFQQQEAVQLNVAAFMQQAAAIDSETTFNERVEQNLEAARMSKLREIAIASIVDDMMLDFIAYECRVEIHAAKYSGGFDDHYASKVQAAYRMSTQKRSYDHKKHVRMRAAQMLQALQRGIIARRRYSEMKVEREKYLFYGFRSSLYHATANMKDPRLRARELSTDAERRRHAFLMQVIQGYVAENFAEEEFRVSAQLVRDLYNENGVVVGCSTNFGDAVVSYLGEAPDLALYARVGDSTHDFDSAPRLFSNSQVSAALLLGLRDQYDDTFGLSSSARRLNAGGIHRPTPRTLEADESAPPRWMLKTCLSFQQANLDRLAGLRLTRKAAGRKSAHLIARDYHDVLASSFDSFDKCRATWEADIRTRQEQQRMLDTFSVDELAQHCLDLLISCVKDWGFDPDPLFEALNLCGRHCHGKAAIRIVEEKFNLYAARMNEVHGKQSVLTLREEISQELEDFEKLLALRCLNVAVDDAVTVPTSELLHIMLKGNLDEEYIRHGLSTVLSITSITEKHDLARKMLSAFANGSYGDAFNLICWSCLDVAENVTVEAGRFLDKLTRPTTENGNADTVFSNEPASLEPAKKTTHRSADSLAARALYLLTGSQAVRFLQFLAKVSHFNKATQKRVLAHLAPYADKYEMHRLASAVCSLDDFSVVSTIFGECFSIDALRSCFPVWTQYTTLFGESNSLKAMNAIKEKLEIPDT
ncbi:hypothetical protein PHYPSEUDO_009573 [Phytophthora pseudosyringae]|uniref:Uncharacterized protein n=1 Tax=Phytophthora pseudosyringae TaxID=221518 RepID=A0A8T1WNS1_9STRA|nr:hypothetical protein PHYPSEUDO_009573 [Phytophthora pseudosyringae]